MNYPKPALTFADQASLLTGRGLTGNPAEIADKLASVSYYRLSAYWYPFRYLLRITAPASQWQIRLQALFSDYPEIPIRDMGFPADWADSPLWQP